LVTPDGDLVRADADHEPDLFWAVRCGGGMGVVTALEMHLYPVLDLYAGGVLFPIQRAAEVLHAWYEWTVTVPEEITSIGRLLRLPPLPQLPEQLRGRAFVMVGVAYIGDAGTGSELIQPLRRLRQNSIPSQPSRRPRSASSTWIPTSRYPLKATAHSCPAFPPLRSTLWSGWPARTPAHFWPPSRSCTWAAR
jgi:hypothetical protein